MLKEPGMESVAWIGAERYERQIVNFKIHEDYEDGQDADHANINDICLLQIDRDILFSEGERLNTGTYIYITGPYILFDISRRDLFA